MEDDTNANEEKSGEPSPRLNWIQKILGSARRGIIGPLVSQNVDTCLAH